MPEQDTIQKVKIGRKTYPVKPFNQMRRKEARALREVTERSNTDIEALWDLLAAVVPDAPQDDIDDLTAEQVEKTLRDAQIITGKLAEGVSLGESAASTDS